MVVMGVVGVVKWSSQSVPAKGCSMMEVRGGWSAGGVKEDLRRVGLRSGDGGGAGMSRGGGLAGARALAPSLGPSAVLYVGGSCRSLS